MNEIEEVYLSDRGNSSILRGFRNCRSYHRARFGNGLSRLVRSRNNYVSVRLCEIEPDINDEVVERTDYINEDTLLHDEEITEFFEQNHLSELDRRVSNMDRSEMITVCCAAVRKYPLAYLQVAAHYILELIKNSRKGSKKMKMMKVFEVGEEVLIKAKVSAIIPDKDRFSYDLIVEGETEKLKHRFTDKDITEIPKPETEKADEEDKE